MLLPLPVLLQPRLLSTPLLPPQPHLRVSGGWTAMNRPGDAEPAAPCALRPDRDMSATRDAVLGQRRPGPGTGCRDRGRATKTPSAQPPAGAPAMAQMLFCCHSVRNLYSLCLHHTGVDSTSAGWKAMKAEAGALMYTRDPTSSSPPSSSSVSSSTSLCSSTSCPAHAPGQYFAAAADGRTPTYALCIKHGIHQFLMGLEGRRKLQHLQLNVTLAAHLQQPPATQPSALATSDQIPAWIGRRGQVGSSRAGRCKRPPDHVPRVPGTNDMVAIHR